MQIYLFLKYLLFFVCVWFVRVRVYILLSIYLLLSVCMTLQVPWNPDVGSPEAGLQNIGNLLVDSRSQTWALHKNHADPDLLSSLSILTCVLFFLPEGSLEISGEAVNCISISRSPLCCLFHTRHLFLKAVFP